MHSRFCPKCEDTFETYFKTCSFCGTRLVVFESRGVSVLRNIMSTKRVIALSIISGSLYLVYWFFRTGKQYQEHTDTADAPDRHAILILIPIVNLFFTYSHMRMYGDLIRARGLNPSVTPAAAVATVAVMHFMPIGVVNMAPQEFPLNLVAILVGLIGASIAAWLLSSVQKDLNSYWQSFSTASVAPLGVGEIVFTVLAILLWIQILVGLPFIEIQIL